MNETKKYNNDFDGDLVYLSEIRQIDDYKRVILRHYYNMDIKDYIWSVKVYSHKDFPPDEYVFDGEVDARVYADFVYEDLSQSNQTNINNNSEGVNMTIDMIVNYEMYLDMEEFEVLQQYVGEKVAYEYSVVNEDGEELVKVSLTEEMLDEMEELLEEADRYAEYEELNRNKAMEIRELRNAIYMSKSMIVNYEMYLDMSEFKLLYHYTGEKVAYGYSVVNEDGEELVKVSLTEEMMDEIEELLEEADGYAEYEELNRNKAMEIRELRNAIYMAKAWN